MNIAQMPIMHHHRGTVDEAKATAETGPQFEISHFDDGEVSENHFDKAMSKYAG